MSRKAAAAGHFTEIKRQNSAPAKSGIVSDQGVTFMNDDPYLSPYDSAIPKPLRFSMWRSIALFGFVAFLVAVFLLPLNRWSPAVAHRTQCLNNMKNIAVALQTYHTEYDAFPPAMTVDAEGRPLHSWRSLILPYLDAQRQYDSIDWSKPWDDPAHSEAFRQMPVVFRCPSTDVPDSYTKYCAIVGEDRFLHPTRPRTYDEITDGASSTLMLLEVSPAEAVPWMAPQDTDDHFLLTFGPETEFAHRGVTIVALADGSVQTLAIQISESDRRALLTIAADDEVSEF